jgi:DNA-binding NarL/FixJ family response regulator
VKQGCLILADSHHNMLGSLRSLLEPLFDTTLMVADEVSLLTATGKVQPDLIVVDLSLPVFGQINVARRLKTEFPDTRFIILSVHDELAAINECLEAGASGFVFKRAAVTDLIPAVEAVLRGETYVSNMQPIQRRLAVS